ncbi:Cilia- and flagella-associated protein 61 [Anthophora retusa]
MMDLWCGDQEVYYSGRKSLDPATEIAGARRMEHADIPLLERLIRSETYEIFGEVVLGRIYEKSCLSMIQYNEKRDVISGICLCNYPNVPSLSPDVWINWLYTLYKVQDVTEGNSMFVHFLAWDRRYTGNFFEELMTSIFDSASNLQHVLLVLPPQIILADIFEEQMIRVPLRCSVDKHSKQSIYMTCCHLQNTRLRIRRIVEEDNDDVIPIIDAETTLVKEFYGEFYVSEMVRHPDEHRRLIVSEDDEGLATGVMFLNCQVDVDILSEKFELEPYNNLRKEHKADRYYAENMEPASETFFSIFSRKPREKVTEGVSTPSAEEFSSEQSVEEGFRDTASASTISADDRSLKLSEHLSQTTFLSDLPSIADYFNMYYQSKLMTSAFVDSIFDIPRKAVVMSTEIPESLLFADIKIPAQPVHYGVANTFALEIFSMQEHAKHRWSRNFIEAAFECFPELDYCVILLPSSHPYLPFLEHFVRVPLRCNQDYPMTLYVTHRAAHLGKIKLREAKLSDRDEVQELLRGIPNVERVLIDFDEAMKETISGLFCYVFLWNDVIVGVTVLCVEKEVTYIKRRYHVEDYIAAQNIPQDAYGRILHFVLMPIFFIHLSYIFCEITRHSGLIVLYYRLAKSAMSALTRTHPLGICLSAMIPVNPRQRIQYKYRGYVETDQPEQEPEPFSLFMISPRLSMMPVTIVDSKIVVVGASDCGMAFAEHLAFGQSFVRFANLTLISPNGLPYEDESNEMAARMLPFRGRYCREYRRTVPARVWINIVYGMVTLIQRKDKYVGVMNQGNITYDYLILTCGLQYQRPQFQEELDAQKDGEFIDYETPWNCMKINDDSEAATCLEKIQTLTNNFQVEKKIVFYGHNIDCYCAIQALLEFGVKGSWITLILPPLPPCTTHESTFFYDCELYFEVMNSISANGIEILVDWQLMAWHLMPTVEEKMIESIDIRLKGRTRTIQCDALLPFHRKTINMKIFLAICRSGLVFNGQLVIDPEFRTNDASIFAAGTITMYCRKFHAESWQHGYFNSTEIGERLAKYLRAFIDNEHKHGKTPFVAFKGKTFLTIPMFRTPKVVACILPGGYRYIHVCKAGKSMLRKIAISYDVYGQVMETGSCTSEIGYFRIRLNRFDILETITCFSKKDFEVHHMIKLHGKHESLLNELKARFQKSLITDFFAYFREPWAMAIFYDRFECLRVENRATLLSKTAIPSQSLINDCLRVFIRNKWDAMRDTERHTIQTKYAGSIYQQEIEENLMEFLQFCEEDLPVYCTPGKLRELFANIEDSPLYTEV